jgi:hypothetical protein
VSKISFKIQNNHNASRSSERREIGEPAHMCTVSQTPMNDVISYIISSCQSTVQTHCTTHTVILFITHSVQHTHKNHTAFCLTGSSCLYLTLPNAQQYSLYLHTPPCLTHNNILYTSPCLPHNDTLYTSLCLTHGNTLYTSPCLPHNNTLYSSPCLTQSCLLHHTLSNTAMLYMTHSV